MLPVVFNKRAVDRDEEGRMILGKKALTAKEEEVFAVLLTCASQNEMAEAAKLSNDSIQAYTDRFFKLMDVRSMTEFIVAFFFDYPEAVKPDKKMNMAYVKEFYQQMTAPQKLVVDQLLNGNNAKEASRIMERAYKTVQHHTAALRHKFSVQSLLPTETEIPKKSISQKELLLLFLLLEQAEKGSAADKPALDKD